MILILYNLCPSTQLFESLAPWVLLERKVGLIPFRLYVYIFLYTHSFWGLIPHLLSPWTLRVCKP